MYGVNGQLKAPFFFGVNSSNGIVTILNDLKADVEPRYLVSRNFYDHSKFANLEADCIL